MYYYQNSYLKFCFNDTEKQFSFFSPPLLFFFNQQDTKIASLEQNIKDLEDEIQMVKARGVLNTLQKSLQVHENQGMVQRYKLLYS